MGSSTRWSPLSRRRSVDNGVQKLAALQEERAVLVERVNLVPSRETPEETP